MLPGSSHVHACIGSRAAACYGPADHPLAHHRRSPATHFASLACTRQPNSRRRHHKYCILQPRGSSCPMRTRRRASRPSRCRWTTSAERSTQGLALASPNGTTESSHVLRLVLKHAAAHCRRHMLASPTYGLDKPDLNTEVHASQQSSAVLQQACRSALTRSQCFERPTCRV